MSSEHIPLAQVALINERTLKDDVDPTTEIEYADFASVNLNTGNVTPRSETFSSAPSRARRLVREGDTIIPSLTGISEWTQIRPLLISTPEVARIVFSTGFYTVSPKSQIVDSRFLNYAMSAAPFLSGLQAVSSGVTMKGYTAEQLAKCKIYLPRMIDQVSIANYLDVETARVDALINKKLRMKNVLEEREEVNREEVVLSASDGSTCSLRWLLREAISDGPHETPDFVDEGVPFLSVDNIVDSRVRFDGCRMISLKDHLRYSQKLRPEYGDVLITKAASVGKVALVEDRREFNVWSPIAVLRTDPSVLLSEFLWQYLRTSVAQRELSMGSTSNTQQNISMRDLGGLRVPVVPIEAQREICQRLSTESRELRNKIEESIVVLRERRHALITAVVTGAAEVSGVAV